MRALPLPARLFVGATIALGALLVVWLGPRATFSQPVLFGILVLASALTSAFKVSLPLAQSGSTLSLSYTMDFAALLLLGPAEAMLIGVVSAWSQCTINAKNRNPLYRTLFSMATLAITMQAAGAAHQALGGQPGALPRDVTTIAQPILGAALTYFVFNTCLIAVAMSLATHQRFVTVWNQNFLWTAPSYFVGAATAALGTWAIVTSGVGYALLTVAPLYLTYQAYQVYLGRIQAERRRGEEMADLHLATIEALALAIDAKDQTAQSHLRRVQIYATNIARGLGMTESDIQGVKTAALLHDIGKLAVPEHILSKPGPLTQEEFQKIRVHPQVGAEIISAVPFPYPVAPLILCHHERWDGKGYPQGLKGEEIPLGARILSVVDYYDALTSDRPYHKAMTAEAAVALLQQEAGRALDPAVVQMFMKVVPALDAALGTIENATPRRLVIEPSTNRGRPAAGLESAGTRTSSVFEDIALAHREIYALYEIAQTMGTSLGVADTMALISSKLSNLVPFSTCALFLFDEDNDLLRCRFATGVEADAISTMTVRTGQGLAGWVARNRRPLVNARPSAEFEAAGLSKSTTLQSALVAPLVFSDRFIGAIAVYSTRTDFYTDDHRRLVDRVSEQASAVIHNSIVFEQTQEDSLTDPLTGLPNTRFMFMHLTRELARAERLKAEVALLVMDLDNFKEINDSHGHHNGDRALREVASVLRSGIRPYDICVRYAGDEFIVVLSGCGADEAERKRVELQRTVDEVLFEARPGRRLPLAISVGAAIYPQDGDTYEALLATADSRMYRDKSRRKKSVQVQPAATGTDGMAAVSLPLPAAANQEISEIEIQRAGFGVL
ncbi:MAG TPA: HD domain-containing phosphohydrolase [Vicinamibacterales bacterium]|nr:HD domain-containing phosphohydrolase [Vicinamibacterales bacterium]